MIPTILKRCTITTGLKAFEVRPLGDSKSNPGFRSPTGCKIEILRNKRIKCRRKPPEKVTFMSKFDTPRSKLLISARFLSKIPRFSADRLRT